MQLSVEATLGENSLFFFPSSVVFQCTSGKTGHYWIANLFVTGITKIE